MSKMSKSTINNMCLHNITGHRSQQINYDMKNATATTNVTQHNKEFIHRNGNNGKYNRTTQVSMTSRKCSSINPYRIFILLVIGFPGLNNGLASAHTKSISLDSNSSQDGNTTNEMYTVLAPTRSSSSLSAEVSASLFELDPVSNKNIRSKMQKDAQMNYRDINRAADRNNNNNDNNSKNFKIPSTKRQPNQIVSLRPANESGDTSSIINNNLHHNNNHKNNKNKNNKNDDNVISSESQKETIVSNAYAAELKGVPPLSIHEHDALHTNGTVDGQFNHNTLDEYYKEPMYFGTENSTTITTQIGANAHLPCTIHHIGEGVVSWIRKRDYHLLTVSLTTYSSDERFSVSHAKHSEDWSLQIKYVQLRDAGLYECQVSVHPSTSIFIYLNVVEARAEIVGPPIRYLTPGSTLKLMCKIVQNTETSAFIFWYHDNRMINYDVERGINVSTEADYHYSELTIQRTNREHSGNYTCVPSNAQPAFVLVHIFKGDNPAAMYHEHRNAATPFHRSQKQQTIMLSVLGIGMAFVMGSAQISWFTQSHYN